MAIAALNVTENWAALEILTEEQLHTAILDIENNFNQVIAPNFTQIGLDVFGEDYEYNNDGEASQADPLIEIVALLAEDNSFTGSNTFEGATTFEDPVTSDSTFSSTGQMRSRGYLSGADQVIANATVTAIAFNAETYDVASLHSTAVNNNNFTIPSGGAGIYSLQGQATFAASNTGRRELRIYKNSAVIATSKEFGPDATEQTILQVACHDAASEGDVFEMRVYQSSSGNLNVVNGERVTFFSLMKVW